jgi:hypothetical protein
MMPANPATTDLVMLPKVHVTATTVDRLSSAGPEIDLYVVESCQMEIRNTTAGDGFLADHARAA